MGNGAIDLHRIKISAGIKRYGERMLNSREGTPVGLASREGERGLQVHGLSRPVSAGRGKQEKNAASHGVHLDSLLGAPSHGIWVQSNARGQGGGLAAHVPWQCEGEDPPLGVFPCVCSPVPLPCDSCACSRPRSLGAAPGQGSLRAGSPALICPRCAVTEVMRAPVLSRAPATLQALGWPLPQPGQCVCCRVPGRQPLPWRLWDGDIFCIQLPGLLRGAFLGSGGPKGCRFPGGARCPFAGALHRFQDACGCSFARRMPSRASLPPTHGQTSLILEAAEAVGRFGEVQHPSLCHLVRLPPDWSLSWVFLCCPAPGAAGAAAAAGERSGNIYGS